MKVVITGSTGMVGKGVLLQCLERDEVKSVVLVNRNKSTIQHEKIIEILHRDFFDISGIKDQLKDCDACFFCLGTTSVGKSEEEYTRVTYDITAHWSEALFSVNPSMTFIFISGQGADSSEAHNTMWKRIKGKAENKVLRQGFLDAYVFRPGLIIPKNGIKSGTTMYNVLLILTSPLHPIFQRMKSVTTTTKIGDAMISLAVSQQDKKLLQNADINEVRSLDS